MFRRMATLWRSLPSIIRPGMKNDWRWSPSIPASSQKRLSFSVPRIGMVRFSRDGKSVLYPVRENNADNLWQQPLDGSPGKQLTSFKAEHIWDYHWSPDGTKLALVRGHTDSDVVLIRSQQQ